MANSILIIFRILTALMALHIGSVCRFEWLGLSGGELYFSLFLVFLAFIFLFIFFKSYMEMFLNVEVLKLTISLILMVNVWVCFFLVVNAESSYVLNQDGIWPVIIKEVWSVIRLEQIFDSYCRSMGLCNMPVSIKIGILERAKTPEAVKASINSYVVQLQSESGLGMIGSFLDWFGKQVLGLGRPVQISEVISMVSLCISVMGVFRNYIV